MGIIQFYNQKQTFKYSMEGRDFSTKILEKKKAPHKLTVEESK